MFGRFFVAQSLVRAPLQDLRRTPGLVRALPEQLGESRVMVRTLCRNLFGPQVCPAVSLVGARLTTLATPSSERLCSIAAAAHGPQTKSMPRGMSLRRFGVGIKVAKMLASVTLEGTSGCAAAFRRRKSGEQQPGELWQAFKPEKPNRLAG